jgi:hypothetical protein
LRCGFLCLPPSPLQKEEKERERQREREGIAGVSATYIPFCALFLETLKKKKIREKQKIEGATNIL